MPKGFLGHNYQLQLSDVVTFPGTCHDCISPWFAAIKNEGNNSYFPN